MAREPQDGDMEDAGAGEQFGPWYDFKTGQQFTRLPMQPISFQKYARKGWIPGIAPLELAAKWEAGAADRKAALDEMVAKQTRTPEFQKMKDDADKVVEASTASADDVADRVIDKLIKLGIIKVPVENEIDQETEAADLEEAGNQLKLL